jgi:hypothetical protein
MVPLHRADFSPWLRQSSSLFKIIGIFLPLKAMPTAQRLIKIAAAEFPIPIHSLLTAHIPMDSSSGSPSSDSGFWGRKYQVSPPLTSFLKMGGNGPAPKGLPPR